MAGPRRSVTSRETVFRLGGILSIALGLLLAAGLFRAGAGIDYPAAWLAAGIAVGMGAFFLYVARDLERYRHEYVAALEAGLPPPPGGPPL